MVAATSPTESTSPQVQFYTVPEVAAILRVGISSAWKLVHSGAIRSHRIGHLVRVPRSAVEALQAANPESASV